MHVSHEAFETKGAFYILHDGQRAAEMTYSKAGSNKIIIDHTEVDPVLKGKGAGKQLVAAAVEFARANDTKIIPLCPFAKAILTRDATYSDVL